MLSAPSRFRLLLALLLPTLGSCTDAGLYAVGGGGATGPDRAELQGTVCVPLASGDQFPVKVLFAFEGGAGVDRDAVGKITTALNGLAGRFSEPYTSFALVAYHTIATGIQGKFVSAADLAAQVPKYSAYQESGPVSARSPLALAESLLSGDMITGCRGTVARTRYVVVLVMFSQDTSCANKDFNPGVGVNSQCNNYLMSGDYKNCSACELADVTEQLRNLAQRYGAGEVSVQPLYVRAGTVDDVTRYQAASIARAGGTELIETDPGNLDKALNNINYASLQRSLKLKRLIAFNRNTISRDGVLLIDSDGDGVPDDDELARGLDPRRPDTDNDGLMDGVEVKMGMDPLSRDVINGCSVDLDTDEDRLNNCEERVLGTDPCITDTDGDGIPDLVEWHQGTNPLIAEDLNDDDGDGYPNIVEVENHTDPHSADIKYAAERAYGYAVKELPEKTPDDRSCYSIDAYNISLVTTLDRPNPPLPNILKGTNDVYLYFQVGRDNDPRGTGIGSLFVGTFQYLGGTKRKPKGILTVKPEDFVVGN